MELGERKTNQEPSAVIHKNESFDQNKVNSKKEINLKNTFFYNMFYLFLIFQIYFWLHWVFVAVRGLFLVAVSRGYSLLQCTGFSLRWLLLLRSTGSRRTGSVVVAHRSQSARALVVVTRGLSSCGLRALGCAGFSSCDVQAQLLCSMQDLPGPVIEPMSPALADEFLTSVPPGKSLKNTLKEDSI